MLKVFENTSADAGATLIGLIWLLCSWVSFGSILCRSTSLS